jgi:hypothetical protein
MERVVFQVWTNDRQVSASFMDAEVAQSVRDRWFREGEVVERAVAA